MTSLAGRAGSIFTILFLDSEHEHDSECAMQGVTSSRSERRHTRILARGKGVPALRWSHPPL
jgi:hypothetical protein